MGKKIFLILFMAGICVCSQSQSSYKILFLNTPSVSIGDKECKVGDTFNADEKIKWIKSIDRQVMKVINLSTQRQLIFSSEDFRKHKSNSLSSYLVQTNNLSSRDGKILNAIDLKNHLNNVFYLIDSITVETYLPTDEKHFFYATFNYNGETINKKLKRKEKSILINWGIFEIDGVAVPPKDIILQLFYLDLDTEKILKVCDEMIVIPVLNSY